MDTAFSMESRWPPVVGVSEDEYTLTLLACFAIFRFNLAIALSLTRCSSSETCPD